MQHYYNFMLKSVYEFAIFESKNREINKDLLENLLKVNEDKLEN